MTAWDVHTGAGTLVTTLDGLARVLRTTPAGAAKMLQSDGTLFASAPPVLQREVKAKFQTGGGDKPPDISNGSFVSWSGGKGRVDLIVTTGKVPGVTGDVEGTVKSPAARVVVWKDGKATRDKIAKATHVLKRIPPLDKPGKKSGPAALVSVLADHEVECDDMGLPAHARLTGLAVKSVYDRGADAWPGPDATTLSADEWAVGRVEHFVKVAAGHTAEPGNDTDLLHPGHPLYTGELTRETPPPGTEPVNPPPGTERRLPGAVRSKGYGFVGGADNVTLDVAEVDAELQAIMDDAAE